MTLANGSLGVDLVLFYIREYTEVKYPYTQDLTYAVRVLLLHRRGDLCPVLVSKPQLRSYISRSDSSIRAFSLTQSVYGWADKPRWRRLFKKINAAGKIVSIVLPLLTVCLLQVPMVQSSFVGFIVLADIECRCSTIPISRRCIQTDQLHSRPQLFRRLYLPRHDFDKIYPHTAYAQDLVPRVRQEIINNRNHLKRSPIQWRRTKASVTRHI